MIKFEDLYLAYLICRQGNRRSEDLIRFELHKYSRLVRLLNQVNTHTFHSDHCYSFILKRPKAREIFGADVEFKIIQVYADMKLRPIIESMLTDRTFNNRKKMGTSAAIKRVIEDIKEVSNNFTLDCWLVKNDFKGYFPNMNQKIAFNKIMQIIDLYLGEDKEEIIYICKYTCFFNPLFRSFRKGNIKGWDLIASYKSLYSKPYGTGGVIGLLWWLIVSNLYLNDYDIWYINNVEKHYTRFVDDSITVTNNLLHVLKMQPVARSKLLTYCVIMHPKKFYCLLWYKGLEFLGFHIKKKQVHLNRKIKDNAFKAIKSDCNCDKLIASVNSYIGMMKLSTDKNIIIEYMQAINRKVSKDFEKLKIGKFKEN